MGVGKVTLVVHRRQSRLGRLARGGLFSLVRLRVGQQVWLVVLMTDRLPCGNPSALVRLKTGDLSRQVEFITERLLVRLVAGKM